MAVDAALKLRIYNDALRHLGSRSLASVSEARESRRVLDSAWRPVAWLEAAEWNFALRSTVAEASPSIEPDFGFRLVYDHPDDYVRLAALSPDEFFRTVLIAQQYTDEAGYWFTDFEPLYVRYVSSDDDYGLNGGIWPESFIRFVGAQLAFDCCERITGDKGKLSDMAAVLKRARTDAKAKDAASEGVKFPPLGSWNRARRSFGYNRG